MVRAATTYLLLVTACSAAGQADPVPVFEEPVLTSVPAPVVFDNTVLSEELRPVLEVARDRWVAASCLDIRLDGGGALWSISMDEIWTPQGERANGSMDTSITPAIGLIWVDSPRKERTATHEMGHRLGIEHVDAKELMSERNLIDSSKGLRYDHIGEAALNALCSVQDCLCFNPEPGPSYDPSLIPPPRECKTITWTPGVGYGEIWGPC